MKAVILAGGFAKRMWPLTENQAKALLPVAGKPIINYILNKLDTISDITDVFVSTNKKFENDFRKWSGSVRTGKNLKLVIENHMEENKKLGAVGGLKYLIDTEKIDDDLLVIAGDNLFEFDLNSFVGYCNGCRDPVVAFYDIGDIEKVRNKFGVAILDTNNSVKDFQEKPSEPKSTLISTCIYLIPREDLRLIDEYLADDNNPDAPGFFIQWLNKKKNIRGFVFNEKWFDIGSFELYDAANKEFKSDLQNNA
jgi:glucose-1-phosphate thymidylyltransferase